MFGDPNNVTANTTSYTLGGSIGGGTLNFNLAGNTADLINLSGTGVLDLTNLKLNFVVSGTHTQQQYVIANQDVGSSFVVGHQFAAITGLPIGWSVDYQGTTADPNEIVLATPEPCAASLVVLLAPLLMGRRKPRHLGRHGRAAHATCR